jgi:hypothetical protein
MDLVKARGLRWVIGAALSLCAASGAGCDAEPMGPPDVRVDLDGSQPDAGPDAPGPRDAPEPIDVPRDVDREPPRTEPCEPRRAPLACNPRRLIDDCEGFGETCTSARSACVDRLPEGSLCRFSAQCDDGLVCTGTVTYGLCVPTPGEGEPCTEVCLEPGRLFCDLDASPPTCATRRAAGSSCMGLPSACAEGLLCNGEMVCVAPGDEGDACASTGECREDLACAEGVCGPLPLAGAPCSDLNTCAPGSFCDYYQFPALCTPRLAEAEPCLGIPLECEGELGCYFDASFAGVCAATAALGDPCSVDRDTCAAGSRCEDGTCTAPPPPTLAPVGAPCDDRQCTASAYCAGVPSGAGICWSPECEG